MDKLIHLEHVEDLIFFGKEESERALNIVGDMIEYLSGGPKKCDIQVKIDGSPSIIAGICPETKKFFVATKSLFNKTGPKINYTPEDITKNHGTNKILCDILCVALKCLPEVWDGEYILQGDVLFVKDELEYYRHDGDLNIFTPNVLTYGVSYDATKDAEIGIAWHTSYKGNTITDLKATYSVNERLKFRKKVYCFNTSYNSFGTSRPSFSNAFEEFTVKEFFEDAKAIVDNCPSIPSLEKYTKEFKRFINYMLRNDMIFFEVEHTVKHFLNFSKKTRELLPYEKDVTVLFELHDILWDIKGILIDCLDDMAKYPYVFLEKEDCSLVLTSPEGYVIIKDNNPVKFVNRDNFSKLNFEKSKR